MIKKEFAYLRVLHSETPVDTICLRLYFLAQRQLAGDRTEIPRKFGS
jgi:hypothetical protein